MITITLFALAIINVLTKKVATISGVSFTILFFIVFELSDIANRKRRVGHAQEMEKFRLDPHADLTADSVVARRATCWWRCAIQPLAAPRTHPR